MINVETIQIVLPSSVPVNSNSISTNWTEIVLYLILTTHPHPHPPTWDSKSERSQESQTLQTSLNNKNFIINGKFRPLNLIIFWGGGSQLNVNPNRTTKFFQPYKNVLPQKLFDAKNFFTQLLNQHFFDPTVATLLVVIEITTTQEMVIM